MSQTNKNNFVIFILAAALIAGSWLYFIKGKVSWVEQQNKQSFVSETEKGGSSITLERPPFLDE